LAHSVQFSVTVRGACRGPQTLRCRAMLVSLVLQTLGLRTRRRGRPSHRLIGFAVPRCPTFLLGNPPLMAPQESVGGLGCPLDQIRCRRPQLSCSWIHPHRQSWHHLGRTHLNPRPKLKPLHMFQIVVFTVASVYSSLFQVGPRLRAMVGK